MNTQDRIAAVTDSIRRVSEQTGAPFLEALALFEAYATKMVQIYNLAGGYPDFARFKVFGAGRHDATSWISVKDKPPEIDDEYLVVIKDGDYQTVTIRTFILNLHQLYPYSYHRARHSKPGWYEEDSEGGYIDEDRVTYWQKKPEPPKEEETE